MGMALCDGCWGGGYCRKRRAVMLSDAELGDAEIIRGVRATAYRQGVTPEHWRDHAANLYRDFPGWIADARGRAVFIDMEPLEEAGREWFEDFCCTPCPDHVTPRVRREAWERVRALGTILRAAFPVEAALWGVRPANDNAPPGAA